VFFPAKIQISKIIDVPYIRAYVWFIKDDKDIIWMWIWLILINISLLDRIWSLWLVRFTHSTPNSIICLDRLIFSVSINSHPDNIYTYHIADRKLSLMKCCVLCYDIYPKKIIIGFKIYPRKNINNNNNSKLAILIWKC